jgi:hypothetical protein
LEHLEADVSVNAPPGFGVGTDVAGLGEAGYMFKSKLSDASE